MEPSVAVSAAPADPALAPAPPPTTSAEADPTPSTTPTDPVSRFLWHQAHLIQKELAATRERDELLVEPHPPHELEASGLGLLHLSLTSARHTWQGVNLSFASAPSVKRRSLPFTTFKRGSIVVIQDEELQWSDYWSTPTNQEDGTKTRSAKKGKTPWQLWGAIGLIASHKVEVIARLPHGQVATPASVAKFAQTVPRTVRIVARADYEVFAIMRRAIESVASPLNIKLPKTSVGAPKSDRKNLIDKKQQQQRATKPLQPSREGNGLTTAQLVPQHMRALLCTEEFANIAVPSEESLPPLPFKPFNSALNEEQLRAIRRALCHPPLYYIKPLADGSIPVPPARNSVEQHEDDDTSSDTSSEASSSSIESHSPLEKGRKMWSSNQDELLDQIDKALGNVFLKETKQRFDSEAKSPQPASEPEPAAAIGLLRPAELEQLSMGTNNLPIHLLHGPPGTGKTTTLVELIAQIVLGTRVGHAPVYDGDRIVDYGRRPRVLVTAPSNLAIDTIAERLVAHTKPWSTAFKQHGIKVARIGNPVRMSQRVAQHMHHFSHHASQSNVQQQGVQNGSKGSKHDSGTITPATPGPAASGDQIHLLERPVTAAGTEEWGQAAQVVLATLHASGTWDLNGEFDYIIIDEACQAVEPLCWVPLMRTNPDPLGPSIKVVIAGDPHQLGPVLLSRDTQDEAEVARLASVSASAEAKQGQPEAEKVPLLASSSLDQSMFERLLVAYQNVPGLKTFLGEQYRSNTEIMEFPNKATYSGGLRAVTTNQAIRLSDLPGTSASRSAPSLLPPSLANKSQGKNPKDGKTVKDTKGGNKDSRKKKAVPKSGGNGKKPRRKLDKAAKAAKQAEKKVAKQAEFNATKNAGKKAAKEANRQVAPPSSASESESDSEDEQDDEDGDVPWDSPLVFYDTAGSGNWETQPSSSVFGRSKSNAGEVRLVVAHVLRLLSHGVQPEQISILTPYVAQVRALLEAQVVRSSSGQPARLAKFYPGLTIGTIDSMQGQENEVVIISLVRSNRSHEIGFLADLRRLNVALTRAKRQLCIVGDSETIGGKHKSLPYLRALMLHLKEHATLPSIEV